MNESRRAKLALPMLRALYATVAVVLLFCTRPRTVLAAPFEGEGRSSKSATSVGSAHADALLLARRAAMQAALDSLDGEPRVPAGWLDQAQRWTTAYRVLEHGQVGDEVVVRVEVEIDVGRLRKRLAAPGRKERVGFRFGGISSNTGCVTLDADTARDLLRTTGVVAGEAEDTLPRLMLSLRCSPLGAVAFTYLHAVRSEVVARGPGGILAMARATGFGDDGRAAVDVAGRAALAELAAALGERFQKGVELTVEHPWPAAHVRHLVRALNEAVVGVRSAAISGVAHSGATRIRIEGDLDAASLVQELRGLHFSTFSLSEVSANAPHAVHVRLQSSP
ncbi:MAG: hypothetical protein V3V08_26340 [Nannocystaceae bacterium]